MTYLDPKQSLSLAIALASDGHASQYDKGGMPYILHPLKVMHYLKSDDLELMSIAVMHDLIEDTNRTFAELESMGFTPRVVQGVKLLTKMPGQTLDEYMNGIKSNTDAIRVKMADLRHNSDIRRLKGVTEKDIARIEKYQKMYAELKECLQ